MYDEGDEERVISARNEALVWLTLYQVCAEYKVIVASLTDSRASKREKKRLRVLKTIWA